MSSLRAYVQNSKPTIPTNAHPVFSPLLYPQLEEATALYGGIICHTHNARQIPNPMPQVMRTACAPQHVLEAPVSGEETKRCFHEHIAGLFLFVHFLCFIS